MVAEEEQGAEKGSENTWSHAMEGFPYGIGDGVGSWGGGERALCQGSGDLFSTERGAVCEGAEDGGAGSGRLRRKEMVE